MEIAKHNLIGGTVAETKWDSFEYPLAFKMSVTCACAVKIDGVNFTLYNVFCGGTILMGVSNES